MTGGGRRDSAAISSSCSQWPRCRRLRALPATPARGGRLGTHGRPPSSPCRWLPPNSTTSSTSTGATSEIRPEPSALGFLPAPTSAWATWGSFSTNSPNPLPRLVETLPYAAGVLSALLGSSAQTGGEGGIRTLDELLTHTHFPGALLKPLGHLSKRAILANRGVPVVRIGVVRCPPRRQRMTSPAHNRRRKSCIGSTVMSSHCAARSPR